LARLLQRVCYANAVHTMLLLLQLLPLHPVPSRTAPSILLLLLLLARRTRLRRKLRVQVWRYRHLPVCSPLEHPRPQPPLFVKVRDELKQPVTLHQLSGVDEHPLADDLAHQLLRNKHLAATRCSVAVACGTVDLHTEETTQTNHSCNIIIDVDSLQHMQFMFAATRCSVAVARGTVDLHTEETTQTHHKCNILIDVDSCSTCDSSLRRHALQHGSGALRG
jgi:hypothetical protein